MRLIRKLKEFMTLMRDLHGRADQIQRAVGRIEARQVLLANPIDLHDAEFQVYSQWGEDGILQLLVHRISIERRVFVEFGVQDYRESNTRFLLQKDNWAGLVLDGSRSNVDAIRDDPVYWRHNLKADCVFVTRENIDAVIAGHGISGDIGLLSIDIDGNDYWVWEALSCVRPRIVIAEYNSLFGPLSKVSIPYDPAFQRTQAHFSNLYWGASIAALAALGDSKGYVLVGSNSAGNNAFFVRKDVAGSLRTVAPERAWVQAQFREARTSDGRLSFLGSAEALAQIGHLPVFDVSSRTTRSISELMPLPSFANEADAA